MINNENGRTTQSEGGIVTITLTWPAYVELLEAKAELDRLKNGAQVSARDLPDAAEYLSQEHPDLIDYAGLSTTQAVLLFPDLFDYEIPERDC